MMDIIQPANDTASIQAQASQSQSQSPNQQQNNNNNNSNNSSLSPNNSNQSGPVTIPVPPPQISPIRGKYEWNRHEGGGVLVTFQGVPPGCHLHWRFEWIRNGYCYGCKYYGFTRSIANESDFSSSFRIQPHRMGFLKREKGFLPILELNYPGRYNLQSWLADANHNLISAVCEEFYEVINVSQPRN